MSLFKRRRAPDYVDLGNGEVGLTDEQVDEAADQAVDAIMKTYEEPIPAEISGALGAAIEQRHLHGDPSKRLKSYLATFARIGYGARQLEDSLDSIRSDVPVLTDELRKRLEAGDTVAESIASVAVSLCGVPADSPESLRPLDSIDGLMPIRDRVCTKTLLAAPQLALDTGVAEDAQLPPNVDVAELVAVWRIGFLIRACEASLPDGAALTPDSAPRRVFVNLREIEAAVEQWMIENPGVSTEEVEEMTANLIANPRYWFEPGGPADENDGEAKYAAFDLDQSGRIIYPQDE